MTLGSSSVRFALQCQCGFDLEFTDEQRGSIAECRCGVLYRIPFESGPIDRFVGYLRWKWWAIRAPKRRELSHETTYRTSCARLSCPGCAAVPDATWDWQCSFCHCIWDTFATRGECPNCGFVYPATQCLACSQTFRHGDWYPRADAIP